MEHNKFNRRVREALEIQKHRSGPKQGGTNFDDGQYLNNTFWVSLMDHISKEENDRRIWRQIPWRQIKFEDIAKHNDS